MLPLVVIAYFATSAASDGIKLAVGRAASGRPSARARADVALVSVGHAATSFACAATLAPFLSRRAAVLYVLAA